MAWMGDSTGSLTWYNQRWYEYTGTTPEQMAGWGWQSVHDPAILSDVLAKWGAALSQGHAFEMIFPLRGADGRFRQFLTRALPLRDSRGQVVRWFGTNTDITEQLTVRRSTPPDRKTGWPPAAWQRASPMRSTIRWRP